MRFVSRVACEFERDTSKDNRSFATLPLSSTVSWMSLYIEEGWAGGRWVGIDREPKASYQKTSDDTLSSLFRAMK